MSKKKEEKEDRTDQDEFKDLLGLGSDEGEEANADENPNQDDDAEDEGEDDDSVEDDETEEDDQDAEEEETEEDEDSEEEDETEDEKDEESGDVKGDTDAQSERYLNLLETIVKGNKDKKEKKVIADIYTSDEFKAFTKVLDLDEDEANVIVNFMKAMQNDTQQKSVEQAMKDTPEVVGKYVNRQSTQKAIKEKFFGDNPQLEAVKGYVIQIANDISAQHADWSVEKVLMEAAKKSYKALNIKKDLVKKRDKPGKRKKPAFAKKAKGARKKAPSKSKIEKDMQAMLDLA